MPDPTIPDTRPRPRTAQGPAQWATAALLFAAGAVVLATIGRFRELETAISRAIAQLITGSRTADVLAAHTFYWAVGTPQAFGLIIQSDCSASWLVGPILVIAGLLAATRRFQAMRVAAGALLAVAVVFGGNLVRIAVIVWATNHYGYQHGFWWSHVVVGSLFTVFGVVVALAILLKVSVGGRRGATGHPLNRDDASSHGGDLG